MKTMLSYIVSLLAFVLMCMALHQSSFFLFLRGYVHSDDNTKIRLYTKSLQKNARAGYVYLSRGYAYLNSGQWKLAGGDFQRASYLMPKNESALFALGEWYWKDGDPNRSKYFYTKTIRQTEDAWIAYLKRSQTRYKIAEDKEALVDYILSRQILRNAPEIDSAVSQFIRLHPRGAFYAFEVSGNAKRDLKHYTEAIQDYSKALNYRPDNADLFFKRAMLFKKIKQKERAILDLNTSLSLQGENLEVIYELCRLYHETKQLENLNRWVKILYTLDTQNLWQHKINLVMLK